MGDNKTDAIEVWRARRAGDVTKLREMATDPTVRTAERIVALRNLCKLKDASCAEIAALWAQGDDERLRASGIASLAKHSSNPAYLPALLSAAEAHEDSVRGHAYRGLGRVGGPEAIAALKHGLEERRWWGRSAAASGLAEAGGNDAAQCLRMAAKHERRPYRKLVLRRRARLARRAL